jgi:hypothetical protein
MTRQTRDIAVSPYRRIAVSPYRRFAIFPPRHVICHLSSALPTAFLMLKSHFITTRRYELIFQNI